MTVGLRVSAYLKSHEKPEIEVQRKFGVDPSRLPSLPQPWALVQGYLSDGESIRVIPARKIAFLRRKDPAFQALSREKLSVPLPYLSGVALLMDAPTVAFKERYLVRDKGGRAWLIDHFPDDGTWICESEFPSEKQANAAAPPSWSTGEMTDKPEGFTVMHAKKRSDAAIQRLLKQAQRDGTSAPYAPSESEGPFNWTGKRRG